MSRLVQLADDRDRVAWFHFCTGHHVEFLYWEATALACEHATSAAERGDHLAVARWLARAATLIRGSGAMLHYCAAFDPARYDPCLRPSMAAEREDFSGDMSRDFLAMMAARAQMAAALCEFGEQYTDALATLEESDGDWRRFHTEVVMSLHPGSSLLRDKLARMRREQEARDHLGDAGRRAG